MKRELKKIMRLYIEDFNQKKKDKTINHVIVPHSIPIIWFGNLNKYLKSKTKVITVSINPSKNEFNEKRFDFINFKKLSINDSISSLYKTLNNYFSTNPYRRWFSSCEYTVNQFNSSYYDKSRDGIKNTAIHIDVYSAIATDPTWSKLNKYEKETIERTDLFTMLINFLKPDVILFSSNKEIFDKMFSNFSLCGERYKNPKDKSRNYIRKYIKGNQTLYWIFNCRGIAFAIGREFIRKKIRELNMKS